MKVDKYNNSLLASLAYLIIIIAGLKAGSSIIVPLLMAFFWFLLFLPLVNKLRSLGMPDLITTVVVFGITLFIVMIVGTFLISSGQDLVANLPMYQEKYHELIPKIAGFFERFGLSLEKNHIIDFFDPMKIIDYTARFLKNMGSIMTNGFMTLIIVMFLFLESSMLTKKMFFLLQTEESKKNVMSFIKNINTYFSIKTLTSALTGIIIYGILAFFDLEYASLFGFIAFLLNYIPSIGSILAAIPAILISLLQLTFVDTVFITIGYLVVNNLIGNLLEPRLLSNGVGISTLFIFLSMVFWGWVLGPVGMFLSVPLTIILKMACMYSQKWKWVSVILDDRIK